MQSRTTRWKAVTSCLMRTSPTHACASAAQASARSSPSAPLTTCCSQVPRAVRAHATQPWVRRSRQLQCALPCASHRHAGVFGIIAAHAFALCGSHSARVQVWQRRHLHRTTQLSAPAQGDQVHEQLLVATAVGRVVRGGYVWRLRKSRCRRGRPVRQAHGLPRSSVVSNDASHGAALGGIRGAARLALAQWRTSLRVQHSSLYELLMTVRLCTAAVHTQQTRA